jgi:tRNA1(Val) A37 N6-methylase TrmN6
MDAMMLAGAIPSSFSGRLADFGAGAGAAGLAVASRCPAARVVLVENAPEMLDCAARTLADPGNTEIAERASILDADVSLTGTARKEAGLFDNSFDLVIMNPPFNSANDRATPDTLKRTAHVGHDGLLESWIRSAAAVVRPRGGLAVIIRPEMLPALLAAMNGRFGSAEIMPIHPRDDKAAIRVVVRAVRGSRAQLRLSPPLFLHEHSSDRFCAKADAINNGLASLFDD